MKLWMEFKETLRDSAVSPGLALVGNPYYPMTWRHGEEAVCRIQRRHLCSEKPEVVGV